MSDFLYAQVDYQFDDGVAAIFSLLVEAATETLDAERGLNGIEIGSPEPYQLSIRIKCNTPLAVLMAGVDFHKVAHALTRVEQQTAHAPLGPSDNHLLHTIKFSMYDAQGRLQEPAVKA